MCLSPALICRLVPSATAAIEFMRPVRSCIEFSYCGLFSRLCTGDNGHIVGLQARLAIDATLDSEPVSIRLEALLPYGEEMSFTTKRYLFPVSISHDVVWTISGPSLVVIDD